MSIDATVIEEFMRAANPIRSLDDIDADELARSATAVHTRRVVVMQALTEEQTQPTPTPMPPEQRRRRAWAFALALILVLASIGVTAFLLVGGDGEVVDEPTPSVTTAAVPDVTTSTPPITSAEPPEVTTTAVPPVDFSRGWSRISALGAPPMSVSSTHLVAVDDVGVLVLHNRMPEQPVPDSTPGPVGDMSSFGAFFFSDGSTWTSGDINEGSVSSVVRWGSGFVAAGTAESTSVAAMWTSLDGITWERVPSERMPPDVRPCDPESPSLDCAISVAATSSSLVVKGWDPDVDINIRSGSNYRRNPEAGCVAWISQDGATWERMEAPPGQELCVFPGMNGWLSVDGNGGVHGSVDGSIWDERGTLPGSPSLWDRDPERLLAAKGGEWLAISMDDGYTWEVAELPEAGQTEAAGIAGDGFFVVAMTDAGPYLFHRDNDDAGWSSTELVGVLDPHPPSDLAGYNGRLYAAAYGTVWEWQQDGDN